MDNCLGTKLHLSDSIFTGYIYRFRIQGGMRGLGKRGIQWREYNEHQDEENNEAASQKKYCGWKNGFCHLIALLCKEEKCLMRISRILLRDLAT